jgi:hypothetical protein
MDLAVDHVTVATRDLDALSDAYTDAGLPATYGGEHSNGATHMSVVGFPDGSYVELISTVASASESPWWDKPIRADGGPCAWAVEVDNIETASDKLRSRGVTVEGPDTFRRERSDGTTVEWDLSFLGTGDPGATLPFLISDRTPRERRAPPVDGAQPAIGVDTVVLGVSDLRGAAERFQSAFALDAPERDTLTSISAEVSVFSDAPVALATPQDDGWFAERLDRFGPCPVAFLLGVESDPRETFDIAGTDKLAGHEIGWIPPVEPVGYHYLGVVETE